MHLKKILRQVNIWNVAKVYEEAGVRAFVIPNGSCKVLYAKCRAGAASTCKHRTPFWEASRHAEFGALDKVYQNTRQYSRATVILFRVLPANHPKAQIVVTDDWALGSADMCKSCVDRLSKMPKARNVSWLTPDATAENQLRPAVPYEPIQTASFIRYQRYRTGNRCGASYNGT